MTTDTIPEAREVLNKVVCASIDGYSTKAEALIIQACLAYHKRMSQDLQQKLTTYEGQTRFFCECGGVRQREEELQKQCDDLQQQHAEQACEGETLRDTLNRLRGAADSWQKQCEELRVAIREHRDQRGDDRCWLDDQKLYAVLGEGPADNSLPPKEKFLANCSRYYDKRCENANWPSYQELEKERDDLRNRAEKAEAEVTGLKKTIDFYKDSMNRVAKEFGIVTPLQMIVRAENNEETYTDVLIKLIREHNNQLTQLQQDVGPLLALAMQNHHGNAVVETFLAAHPECKP